jgi:hypothetical protein
LSNVGYVAGDDLDRLGFELLRMAGKATLPEPGSTDPKPTEGA